MQYDQHKQDHQEHPHFGGLRGLSYKGVKRVCPLNQLLYLEKYSLCVREGDLDFISRKREILMKVVYLKVHLGDSNRQSQPNRENLE